jgi:hypothetical protein
MGQACQSGTSPPAGTYVIYYHTACAGFYGRAMGCSLMLAEAGVPYEYKEPKDYPTKGFAPPMMTSPSGAMCAQTAAISITLGKELGFAPADPAGLAKATQLAVDACDLMSEADKPDERVATWYQHLEDNLAGTYFCGKLSFADFSVMQTMIPGSVKKKELFAKYPKLNAWFNNMKSLKGYQKLKATGVPMMPEQYGLVALP